MKAVHQFVAELRAGGPHTKGAAQSAAIQPLSTPSASAAPVSAAVSGKAAAAVTKVAPTARSSKPKAKVIEGCKA